MVAATFNMVLYIYITYSSENHYLHFHRISIADTDNSMAEKTNTFILGFYKAESHEHFTILKHSRHDFSILLSISVFLSTYT